MYMFAAPLYARAILYDEAYCSILAHKCLASDPFYFPGDFESSAGLVCNILHVRLKFQLLSGSSDRESKWPHTSLLYTLSQV